MMRFDRFSSDAQDAAARAYQILQRYGHSQIDTEHVLLGMLEQSDTPGVALITRLGADVDALKSKLGDVLAKTPRVMIHGQGVSSTQIFITPRVKRGMDLANETSGRLGDNSVTTKHLLIAIASERNTPAARLLEEVGITRSRLEEVIQYMRVESDEQRTTSRQAPADQVFYHVGFSRADLGDDPPTLALLSGDPDRASHIADNYLTDVKRLSEHRGLNSYVGALPIGRRIVSATSGMGAPSLSIVVNELVQVGIKQIIRIGTCGSIQAHVKPGSVVISSAALCRQGAANDIAPVEYPASADPFLTVALANAARKLGIEHHVGITASVDTFYEGQERTESANPHLLRALRGVTDEYRHLNVLNYEMESGTLFKMGGVYGFAAACVCGVIAQRTASEQVVLDAKAGAVENAIKVAIAAASAGEN